jgi:hypothetical protein
MTKKQIRLFGKIVGHTILGRTSGYIFRVRRRRVRRTRRPATKSSRKNYLVRKETARTLVLERLEHFRKFYATNNTAHGYAFKVGRVSIRNQKTRWGSCSKTGNLNFNYRIVLLPPRLCNYIIVHELCHLGEFNHSSKFWSLVALACPDYAEIRAELKGRKLW